MKAFAAKVNLDPREPPYSNYCTSKKYKEIDDAGPMHGFHECANFLQEDGAVRGYLPPRVPNSLRNSSRFILVTVTSTEQGNNIFGIQFGCQYVGTKEGGGLERKVPGRNHPITYHFECLAKYSLIFDKPLENATGYILKSDEGSWHRNPTKEIYKECAVKDILDMAVKKGCITSTSANKKLNNIRSYIESSTIKSNLLEQELRIQNEIKEDIEKIKSNKKVNKTTRKLLIDARLGQGKFRADLLDVWKGKCAATSCQELSVLRASHIVPWRRCENNKERLDQYNGLLLAAHIDALFDRNLITFDSDGKIEISPELKDSDIKLLKLKGLSVKVNSHQVRYLRRHKLKG